jgi:ABC-type phosphate transport system auxiliary subunit
MKLVLKIAAGILLAGFILFLLRLLILGAAITSIHNAADDALKRQKQLIAERQERAKEEERIKLERELQAAAQARLEAERTSLKNQAWSKYYQDPEECLVFQSDAHMVKCVDHKKKARREFERLYEQGKIQ